MERVLILGAGTAGTMAANLLRKQLARSEYEIVVVDPATTHFYQPGFLFIPFGSYSSADVVRPITEPLHDGIRFINDAVTDLDPERNRVQLQTTGTLPYDHLVIATGTHPVPNETPGLDSEEMGRSIHHFYSLRAAELLRDALAEFTTGTLAVNLIEMPIKCPVAPLEFAFLADAHFEELGIRDDIDIVYVTPMSSPFTKPVASELLGDMFDQRNIRLEPDFYLERVDADNKRLVSYDERSVDYDLLVTVPINMGAAFLGESGLGDELNHVPVDAETFQSTSHRNIFAIGDAANLPTSKAGSVVHFSMETFVPNFVDYLAGRPMKRKFDGHANCYIETGHDRAMLIDFNYKTQPLRGKYPIPGVGPFSLLKESKVNHQGKLAFRWMYWKLLLPGHKLPVSSEMSMAGKQTDPD